jgi:protein-tyrosine phosphatase
MSAGRIYRADDPTRLTAAGHRTVDGLHLAAVIDMRQKHQFDRDFRFADRSITHNVPMVDRVIDTEDPAPIENAADIADLYVDMVERGGGQLVRAAEIVAEHLADGPVLIHCAAGKDRTGLLVALIQSAIGVPAASIVAEYALSDDHVRRRRAAMIASPLPDDPPVARSPEQLWTAPAETMERYTRRIVDIHGSLGEWVTDMGLSPATVQRLREQLLRDGRDHG